jgi:hypothetical protein
MKLTDEQVAKFQRLYFERFGEEISKADAYEGGMKLMHLMYILYRPMTRNEVAAVQNGREPSHAD